MRQELGDSANSPAVIYPTSLGASRNAWPSFSTARSLRRRRFAAESTTAAKSPARSANKKLRTWRPCSPPARSRRRCVWWKNGRRLPRIELLRTVERESSRSYRSGARPLALRRAGGVDRIFDSLSLGEVVELLIGHRRMVEENVAAVLSLDEPETFVQDQFLDCPLRHLATPYHANAYASNWVNTSVYPHCRGLPRPSRRLLHFG